MAALLSTLAACTTVPVPEPVQVVIPTEPVQTCAPVSALQQVVIPAETRTQYGSVIIEDSPTEIVTKRVIVTKPAQIIYVDSAGQEVIDICEPVQRGATGPGIGEVLEEG